MLKLTFGQAKLVVRAQLISAIFATEEPDVSMIVLASGREFRVRGAVDELA